MNSRWLFPAIISVAILTFGSLSVSAEEETNRINVTNSEKATQNRRDTMEQKRLEMKINREQNETERTERKIENEARKTERGQMRCENVVNGAGRVLSRLTEFGKNFTDRKSDWNDRWQQKVAKTNISIDSSREEATNRREEMYTNMLSKATTDEQKAAITKFQQAVEAAVKERHTAVDAAITAFRTAAKQVRDGRKTINDTAVTQFKTAVEAAITQAKTDCAAGKDPKAVLDTLRSSLKTAQETFRSTRKSDENVGQQMKKLVEIRQAAFRKALETFKAKLEAARAELKATLKPTPTPSLIPTPTSTPTPIPIGEPTPTPTILPTPSPIPSV